MLQGTWSSYRHRPTRGRHLPLSKVQIFGNSFEFFLISTVTCCIPPSELVFALLNAFSAERNHNWTYTWDWIDLSISHTEGSRIFRKESVSDFHKFIQFAVYMPLGANFKGVIVTWADQNAELGIMPYLNNSKNQISQETLNLIMFYHNHLRYNAGKRKGQTQCLK
jgi:hypothetical protein